MASALNLLAGSLSSANGRHSPDNWLRRAYEVTRHAGPLNDVEGRMLVYLEARFVEAGERQARQEQLRLFRSIGRITEEVAEAARERQVREGGISHDHAQELGYASVADFLAYQPEAD